MYDQELSLHHVSLLVADTSTALHFYRDVLGLQQDHSRPEMGFAGAWLRVGDQQIHLLELPNPDACAERPAHGGQDRHVAFNVQSLESLRQRLDAAGIPYTLSQSGRSALFCRDPDANALEFIQLST